MVVLRAWARLHDSLPCGAVQDETYEAYLPQLAKLAFLASAVHQAVFLLFSTLPFAVGQVQDVGLIFLSAMASSISARCAAQVVSPASECLSCVEPLARQ